MRKVILIIAVLAIVGCGHNKQPQLVENQPATSRQTVAEEVRAMSQKDVAACNRIPATIHDPSFDAPTSPQNDPMIDKKIVGKMEIGEERWIWGVVKDDDGKLYVDRYVTGYKNRADDRNSDIHIKRTGSGIELDCKSPLYILLNKKGPFSDKRPKGDLIPIVGMIGALKQWAR